ncbi:hypothetical protein BN1095_920029 [Clostridioides difficile]|uniref:AAA domain-containing protein n=1 Tax=Clostridioides difficile TaxID=1496 RepID=A0A069AVV8_CLODI|nr:hypothetical protein BN1095_920029 [Clostridioides difficile]
MKIISILSFKGGTGKTITSANMADILSVVHKKRVLLIDADKQGNLSQYFSKFEEKKEKVQQKCCLKIMQIYMNTYVRLKIKI